jgi:osmoprotectant transport system permease protein
MTTDCHSDRREESPLRTLGGGDAFLRKASGQALRRHDRQNSVTLVLVQMLAGAYSFEAPIVSGVKFDTDTDTRVSVTASQWTLTMPTWAALQYISDNSVRFTQAVQTHLMLSLTALLIAAVVCIPLGILTSRSPATATMALGVVNTLRVIPSLAILLLVFPFLGLGAGPALVALTVLACPPILINTDAGFRNVDPAIMEAARGMGMDPSQVLRQVQLPLALPVIVAGVRTAAIEVIASATLAAFIGSGGLGDFIAAGLALNDTRLLLVGAVPVALMALLAEALLSAAERRLRVHTA